MVTCCLLCEIVETLSVFKYTNFIIKKTSSFYKIFNISSDLQFSENIIFSDIDLSYFGVMLLLGPSYLLKPVKVKDSHSIL